MRDDDKIIDNENINENEKIDGEQIIQNSNEGNDILATTFDDLIKKCEKLTDLEKLIIKIKERISKKKDE